MNRFLFLVLGLLVSFAGLNAADTVGEHRRYLTLPQGAPTSANLAYSGEHLTFEWESTNNTSFYVDVTFNGTEIGTLRCVVDDESYYHSPTNSIGGKLLESDEFNMLARAAIDIRKGWRVVHGLAGDFAFEVEPYTLVSETRLPHEDYVLIFKRGDVYLAIPNGMWLASDVSHPALGSKVIVGRSDDAFCPVELVFGDPKIPSAMLRQLADTARENEKVAKQ